jgi:succinate--hydroxymethylglutarate CoA-transferase
VILDKAFRASTTSEWLAVFEGSGMPYGPINTLEKVFSHPQTQARQMVETVPHEAAVSGSIKVLGKKCGEKYLMFMSY